jgi:hypothetical protein
MKAKAYGEARNEIKSILDYMTDLCKTDLPCNLIRAKYETIITILVYLNTVIQGNFTTRDPNSF